MDTHDLKITRPCPIELDADRSGRQFFCDHCQKDVHVLANWTRAEAEAFIAANRGNSVCVSLRRDVDGELLYADSPARTRPAALVPVARLRRRWLPEAAAAAGVVAALSACAPHQPFKGAEHLRSEDDVSARAIPGGIAVPDEVAPARVEDEELPCERAVPEPTLERGKLARIEPAPAPRRQEPTKKAPRPTKSEPVERGDIIDGGIDF